MIIEPSITYGAIAEGIISIFSFIGLYALFVAKQDKHISLISYKVDALTTAVEAVEKILRIQIEQTTRISQLEKLVDELRHGEGMVIPLFGRDRS